MIILHGDSSEKLKELEDNSIDAIVTDPPYGLSFMGKKWDYDVPSVEIWKECLRVLKPGGHALIACGTRTQHRMAVNIEDAGFEIRDVVTWLYGSGFPKSLDISKAIDKAAGANREVVGVSENIRPNSERGNGLAHGDYGKVWSETTPATDLAKQWAGWGTALKPATEHWTLAVKPLGEIHKLWYETHKLCQSLLNVYPVNENLKLSLNASNEVLNTAPCSVEESINTLADLFDQMATLQSVSVIPSSLSIALLWRDILDVLLNNANMFTIETASNLTTDLKILNCFLSKIIQGNITEGETRKSGAESNAFFVESFLKNVLLKLNYIQDIDVKSTAAFNPNAEFWTLARKPLEGTVAKNVEKWGVGGLNIDGCRVGSEVTKTVRNGNSGKNSFGRDERVGSWENPPGRFPANLILDEVAAEQLDLMSFDNGGTSRFFYCAKASKSERNAGCEGLDEKAVHRYGSGLGEGLTPEAPSYDKNHHPTVKPIKLMSYLCRLITPPNGTVLDPFMGSGSTGVAAKKEGFKFIGIEREAEYVEIAKRRIEHG